jgi:glycosyltransferase involved in cell wall biosynthesis
LDLALQRLGSAPAHRLEPDLPLLRKSALLRQWSGSGADVVVLHTHPEDPVPVLAFCRGGGPPVLYVNHADHAFGLTAGVADIVVEFRAPSVPASSRMRSAERHAVLPIPLDARVCQDASARRAARSAARARLGVPEAARVFVTTGSSYKFKGWEAYSFAAMARALLGRDRSHMLVAIGVDPDEAWAALARESGGRFLPLGPRSDVESLLPAGDVYLEGFPFGSQTALLEAIVSGLPVVRAPADSPARFVADEDALDPLAQPVDIASYVEHAIALMDGGGDARTLQEQVRERVRADHLDAGWRAHLERVVGHVPVAHESPALRAVQPLPEQHAVFWMRFIQAAAQTRLNPVSTFQRAWSAPCHRSWPALTGPLEAALSEYGALVAGSASRGGEIVAEARLQEAFVAALSGRWVHAVRGTARALWRSPGGAVATALAMSRSAARRRRAAG